MPPKEQATLIDAMIRKSRNNPLQRGTKAKKKKPPRPQILEADLPRKWKYLSWKARPEIPEPPEPVDWESFEDSELRNAKIREYQRTVELHNRRIRQRHEYDTELYKTYCSPWQITQGCKSRRTKLAKRNAKAKTFPDCGFTTLPEMRFPDGYPIYHVQSYTEAQRKLHLLIDPEFFEETPVGFDAEWTPDGMIPRAPLMKRIVRTNQYVKSGKEDGKREQKVETKVIVKPISSNNPATVITIATRKGCCICRPGSYDAPYLKRLLTEKQENFYGVGVGNDRLKLSRLGLGRLPHVRQVDRMAAEVGYGPRNLSVTGLCAMFLRHRLEDTPELTMGLWHTKKLSKCQLEYAAMDAYVALLVGEQLKERVERVKLEKAEELADIRAAGRRYLELLGLDPDAPPGKPALKKRSRPGRRQRAAKKRASESEGEAQREKTKTGRRTRASESEGP